MPPIYISEGQKFRRPSMKLRFIEYQGGTYLIIGYSYCTLYSDPECYVGLDIKDIQSVKSLSSEILGKNIPLAAAKEIKDPKKLRVLRILYGK